MTDTQPRQKNRKVGAKPAQTRNADTRLVQLSLNIPRAVAFHPVRQRSCSLVKIMIFLL